MGCFLEKENIEFMDLYMSSICALSTDEEKE